MWFSLAFLFAFPKIGRTLKHGPGYQDSWTGAVAEVEEVLRKDCGEDCVKVMQALFAASEITNRSARKDLAGARAMDVLADHVLQQVDHSNSLQQTFSQSLSDSLTQKGLRHKTRQPTMANAKIALADTPCNSQTLCSIDGLVANKCSYMRKGIQLAYQSLNVVVHVLGALITALCGCIFVFTQAICVLKAVPPICIRPYSVYAKAFAGSVQTWESVKSMTKTCIMHGSPAISS